MSIHPAKAALDKSRAPSSVGDTVIRQGDAGAVAGAGNESCVIEEVECAAEAACCKEATGDNGGGGGSVGSVNGNSRGTSNGALGYGERAGEGMSGGELGNWGGGGGGEAGMEAGGSGDGGDGDADGGERRNTPPQKSH